MGNPPPRGSEELQDPAAPFQLPPGGQHSPAVGFLMQSTAEKKGANEKSQFYCQGGCSYPIQGKFFVTAASYTILAAPCCCSKNILALSPRKYHLPAKAAAAARFDKKKHKRLSKKLEKFIFFHIPSSQNSPRLISSST